MKWICQFLLILAQSPKELYLLIKNYLLQQEVEVNVKFEVLNSILIKIIYLIINMHIKYFFNFVQRHS